MFAQDVYLTANEASEYLRLRTELRDAAKAYTLDQNAKNLEWVLDVSRRLLKLKRT